MRYGMLLRVIGCLVVTTAASAVEPVAVQYGKDPKQSLNIYLPEAEVKGPVPVVIWVHGGGWRNGDKDNRGGVNLCQTWARAGFVVVGLDYRLTPAVVHPAHVEDVAAGIAWVHNNIVKHGGDPKRVFLLGHSAGAHLVALVATAAKYLKAHDLLPKSALAGVMAIDTASYDLTTTRSLAVRKMISDAFGDDAKTLHDASPLQHARQNPDDCPPFVIAAVKQRPEAVSESKALSAVLPKSTLVLVDYYGNGQLAAHSLIAYDDSNITLNGKFVVGPVGGTFRATERMNVRFGRDVPLTESQAADIVTYRGLGDQIVFHVHTNPQNRILHTALVGEMNGLLEATADATTKWGAFGGPRAYTKMIQPATGIPSRPSDAAGGSELLQKLASLSPADREEVITREILRGNIPDFLRKFQSVKFPGEQAPASQPAKSNISSATSAAVRSIIIEVMPDYLAVGSDDDFVRVPMTPMAAQRIADAFGCALPTKKIVDQIYKAASVKLPPMPLTEAREATETFLQHNTIVEKQRTGRKLGELVAGTKKDVVVTNRLTEKPNRVAIYGWHKLDGVPIQPLTIVHHNTYVDYSHGIRLVRRTVTVNDKPRDIRHVLHAAELCPLLSDEGPLDRPSY